MNIYERRIICDKHVNCTYIDIMIHNIFINRTQEKCINNKRKDVHSTMKVIVNESNKLLFSPREKLTF